MSFRLENVTFESRELDFIANSHNVPPQANCITVIIGKNGCGKSRMLSSITEAFSLVDRLDSRNTLLPRRPRRRGDVFPFSLEYRLKGSIVSLVTEDGRVWGKRHVGGATKGLPMPPKIIAISVSPFDKFPLTPKVYERPEDLVDRSKLSHYYYLGARTGSGHSSPTSQVGRVIESLMLASRKNVHDQEQLKSVFSFLGYAPRVSADYGTELSAKDWARLCDSSSPELFHNLLFELRVVRGEKRRAKGLSPNVLGAAWKAIKDPYIRDKIRWDQCVIELDFSRGKFTAGSLDSYLNAAILRRIGALTLKDFRLFKPSVGEGISIKQASSGEQCIAITILGIASQLTDDSLVCIDEPEISLHPAWQQRYVDLMLRTFERYTGCHFLLATHSPQIVSSLGTKYTSVLNMETDELLPAGRFFERSADYQLAEVFSAPGHRNEFLLREALSVLTGLAKAGAPGKPEQARFLHLVGIRRRLSDSDPVSKLIDSISSAYKELGYD